MRDVTRRARLMAARDVDAFELRGSVALRARRWGRDAARAVRAMARRARADLRRVGIRRLSLVTVAARGLRAARARVRLVAVVARLVADGRGRLFFRVARAARRRGDGVMCVASVAARAVGVAGVHRGERGLLRVTAVA